MYAISHTDVHRSPPSADLGAVCVFSLFGLVLTALVVPLIAPEHLTWVLSHIE